MIILKNRIVIWLFLLSTTLPGIFWEVIGWLSLFYVLIKSKKRKKMVINRDKLVVVFIVLITISVVIAQIVVLHLSILQIIKLYGITKTVIAFPIMYLMLGDYISQHDVIEDILPFILIIDWITIIALVTENSSLNLIGGSRNFLGAVNVLLFPGVYKFFPLNNKKTKFFYLATLLLLVLFSGSRTLMATAAIIFLGMVVLEKSINKKARNIMFTILIILIAILLMEILGQGQALSRGMSVFKGIEDQARVDLFYSARMQYAEYSKIEKMIGNGDVIVTWRQAPVHNCFFEILLCYGKIGFVLFCIYLFWIMVRILKSNSQNRIYMFLIFGVTILMGLVQPFITTGFLFQVVAALAILNLYYAEKYTERS